MQIIDFHSKCNMTHFVLATYSFRQEVKLGEIYRFLFMGSCITSKQKHPRNRTLIFDIKLFSTDSICWKPEAIQSADTNLRR